MKNHHKSSLIVHFKAVKNTNKRLKSTPPSLRMLCANSEQVKNQGEMYSVKGNQVSYLEDIT